MQKKQQDGEQKKKDALKILEELYTLQTENSKEFLKKDITLSSLEERINSYTSGTTLNEVRANASRMDDMVEELNQLKTSAITMVASTDYVKKTVQELLSTARTKKYFFLARDVKNPRYAPLKNSPTKESLLKTYTNLKELLRKADALSTRYEKICAHADKTSVNLQDALQHTNSDDFDTFIRNTELALTKIQQEKLYAQEEENMRAHLTKAYQKECITLHETLESLACYKEHAPALKNTRMSLIA